MQGMQPETLRDQHGLYGVKVKSFGARHHILCIARTSTSVFILVGYQRAKLQRFSSPEGTAYRMAANSAE
jgi:hypothetical protein